MITRRALGVLAAVLIGQAPSPVLASEELFKAIEQSKELAAEGLILRGRADVNARNAKGETPLHRAVEKGMKDVARALIKAGAPLHARTGNGETALHLAALHDDPWFVDLLLSAGANPNARNDDGESVLFWAVLTGHGAVAQRLLDSGADPKVKDLKGQTAQELLEKDRQK